MIYPLALAGWDAMSVWGMDGQAGTCPLADVVAAMSTGRRYAGD